MINKILVNINCSGSVLYFAGQAKRFFSKNIERGATLKKIDAEAQSALISFLKDNYLIMPIL
jgi:hypothetical protein